MTKTVETHNLIGKVVEIGHSVDEDMSIQSSHSVHRPSNLITSALEPFEGRKVRVRIEITVEEIK